MDKNQQMEARVWSRVMSQKAEEPTQKCEISALLSAECADYAFFRCLGMEKLACLTKENIKILKTLYFVETGRCYCPEKCKKPCISNVCSAMREMYKKVKNDICRYETMGFEYETIVKNKQKQLHIIACFLQGKV